MYAWWGRVTQKEELSFYVDCWARSNKIKVKQKLKKDREGAIEICRE